MNRKALLVLGMHRGGTSAVAGLLVRLGACGPKTLMPADAHNPEGYWESTVFCQLHERLLRAAGSQWDTYTRLDPEGLRSRASAELRDEFRQAIRAEFGSSNRFVLKDPRMCRLVPFWFQLLESEGIDPAVALVVRNPAEIARSLAVRNGFERDLSLLIWLRHMLDAEFDTRGIQRALVRYQDVVENWKVVADRISRDLEVPWRSRTSAEEEEIDRFVRPGLHRYREELDAYDGVAPVLGDWLRRTSTALQQLHDRGQDWPAAFAELDAVRLDFNRATSALGDVSDRIRGGLEALRADLGQQVEALQRHAHAIEQDKTALQRELSAAQQDARALRESASWRMTAPLRAVYRLFR